MTAESAFVREIRMARHASSMLALPWELEAIAGEGESAIVWRGRESATGRAVAIKIAKRADALLHEAEIVARVERRWGPKVLGAGRMPSGVRQAHAGAPYVVSEWALGAALDPLALKDRERAAAIVAHGVGRALAELHAASVRHGDV